uniref:Uncharacterized protein n=1 Tax=Emiliania huxleyi TaxID=2903 RepID=A0A7S3S259_EMIHU|mmetsp:Transcript_5130/g.14995  ORF Transcript_5130/g.14995 Transcript_5130/m.14995 type:complete len:134 (+) Transcript_5130:35-436(+)
MRLVVTLSLATLASAFTLSPALPRSCASARPLGAPPAAALQPSRSPAPAMGLFGLGWPELGVIGVAGLFLFGPERLAGLAKDLGKQSAGLKEVAESFQEGMAEAEAMPNLKSAEADDPPRLEKVAEEEKQDAR